MHLLGMCKMKFKPIPQLKSEQSYHHKLQLLMGRVPRFTDTTWLMAVKLLGAKQLSMEGNGT
ncbi:hypothetical protein CHS0354_036161 [Potamilus streckersoni]|uniref:Uncharacterized protein n=1 Tax=Potamilus streckersoni TaxID=2493646 RepID=A0AAE0T3N6_9BIVA|nr:hypothetical protein CHS0354_036161 [Potamilus streckersoni]